MRHCRLLSCLLLHLNGRAHPLRLDSIWNFGRRARQVHTIESIKIIAFRLYPNWRIVRPACPQHPLLVPSSSLAAAVSSRGIMIAAVSCHRIAPPYRAAVSLPPHRAEPPYRCRIMSPQRAAVSSRGIAAVSRREAPPYQAAVSCSRIAPPYRASVSLLYHSGAFLYHIGLWSAPSVGRAICLLPRLFACYAVTCKSVACPHRLSSASPSASRLARSPPVSPAASVACPCRLSPVSLLYHAAATRHCIEPPFRFRIMPPQCAAVSSSGIAAVSCRRNAVTRRRIKLPYHTAATLPPFRAYVSLLYHAVASRRRIEPPYRCRIMQPQRRDAPQYQAAVSCRSNAPPY